ncbi:beta strand repeat-containing protein [Flammeovirga kamogawensis]|uniref:T9SS type A sorting domain-containing protein n=1 Tax=Flammeovirga kamogawensis TaxID=373891 RepID=A0ABX8H2K0_9BACT|nr:choice-of-anchor Q domain-containing protein [Flammeovirga kamogawensis]MBB6462619.1 putative outer membrane repeat protein [Flammeovirga kamogawensis]QWG09636.1 hypothetical protein KM029_23825 [Flammeovirga kamogawensis]TRX65150.1 hypothetical protein EO216_21725 [Flammeovirga kamogawensis]
MKRTITLISLLLISILNYGANISSDPAKSVFIGTTEYATISAAITAATNGDVIDIHGVHTESINITKNITIQGDNPLEDIIQAAETKGVASSRVVTIQGSGNDVTLSNLTIRHGVATAVGGGVFIENANVEVALSNVIVSDNSTNKNGGGIAAIGSIVTIDNSVIENNATTLMGGGIYAAPKTASTVDASVKITNSLIDNNSSTSNAGGIFVDGSVDATHYLAVELENTTVSNNSSSAKGGAFFGKNINHSVDGVSNVAVLFNHATIAYNTASTSNSGIYFYSGGEFVDFTLTNSIISLNDTDTDNDLAFAKSNPVLVKNNVLGLVSDLPADAENTLSSQFSDEIDLATGLSDNGTIVKGYALGSSSVAIDLAVGSTVSTDAIGIARGDDPDAGALEREVIPFDPINTVFIGTTQYYTITEALTAAVNGDVIDINGVHTESISIDKNVTIQGDNPLEDIIQAAETKGTATDRVVKISGSGNEVTLANLTVRHGVGTGVGGGVFIENAKTGISIENVIVSDNTSPTMGGGIAALGSIVMIDNSVVENNTATTHGGGIYSAPKLNSTVDGNVKITNSLIANNTATNNAGGIFVDGSTDATHYLLLEAENTTISNNTASGNGGAFFGKNKDHDVDGVSNVAITFNHVTIAYNSATSNSGVYFYTGGEFVDFTLTNSIISLNDTDTDNDLAFAKANPVLVKNNVLGLVSGLPADAENTLSSQFADEIDLSTEFVDNGGIVKTYSIGSLGSAIDFASDSELATDALGLPRDEKPDAGAFEGESIPFDPINTVFIGTTQYYTITEALTAAVNGDVIDINGVHTESISIDKNVTIQGDNPLEDIIQAAETKGTATDRVVKISGSGNEVTLANLTVRHGVGTGVGGGVFIENAKTGISIENVIVSDNTSSTMGGGIAALGSIVMIDNSVVENNTATTHGGGIYSAPKLNSTVDGNVKITNSLIANNTATNNAGGIFVDGSTDATHYLLLEAENTTISNNTASGNGGAFFGKNKDHDVDGVSNVAITFNHVTIAYNSATSNSGVYFYTGGEFVDFTLTNSIISLNDTDTDNDLAFAKANPVLVKNNVLGLVSGLPAGAENTLSNQFADEIDLSTEFVDNGGIVKTYSIGSLGSAIDFASDSELATDALGLPRDEKPDAGAFEGESIPFDPINTVFIGDKQFYTITSALASAVNGDVIDINGVHTESFSITKNVTIQGDNPLEDIIQAAETKGTATDRVVKISGSGNEVTLANLTVRHGVATGVGGGVFIENANNLITFSNSIFTDNTSTTNGAGVGIAGSIVKFVDCTFENNEATSSGGGIYIFPKLNSTVDADVEFSRCLIANNSGINGAGLFIDGTVDDTHKVDVFIENTTIALNSASGNGGGVFLKGKHYTATEVNNVSIELNHVTIAQNDAEKSNKGLYAYVGKVPDTDTNFAGVNISINNSLVSLNGETTENDISFGSMVATSVKNNVFGKVNALPEIQENTLVGKISVSVVANELTDEGGKVKVLVINGASEAINHADITTASSVDATNKSRDENPDAGAFEGDADDVTPPPVDPDAPIVWLGTLSGDWTIAANWEGNKVPESTQNVFISADAVNILTIDNSNFTVNNLEIENIATVFVENDYALIVKGDLTGVGNGKVFVKYGGSLITHGNVTGWNHKFTTQDSFGSDEYKLVGSTGIKTSVDTAKAIVQIYDPSLGNSEWLDNFYNVEGSEVHVMEQGKGYLKNDLNITFSGTPNTGRIEVPLIADGIDLIANPYPAAISFDNFIEGNDNVGAVYMLHQSSLNDSMQDEYTTVSRLGATTPNGYNWEGYIRHSEGFFVETLGINEKAFFETEMTIENIRSFRLNYTPLNATFETIKLALTNDNGVQNQVIIGFSDQGSNAYDYSLDAYKKDGLNGVKIYSKIDEGELAINCLPIFEQSISLPLYISVDAQGEYNIRIPQLTNMEKYNIGIEDVQTGKIKVMEKEDAFSFISDVTTDEHRLNLILSTEEIITSIDDQLNEGVITIKPDGIFFLNKAFNTTVQVTVLDVVGNVLLQQSITETHVPYGFEKNKVYIVKVASENGVVTKKVMF